MYVDCQIEVKQATQYRIVDVETGAEVRDCVAACDDEGWILIAQPHTWTAQQQPCRLEFRRIKIVPAHESADNQTTTRSVDDIGSHFSHLLDALVSEIAATCLHLNGTWLDPMVVQGQLRSLERRYVENSEGRLSSVTMLAMPRGLVVAAVTVEAYYDRVHAGHQVGYRGSITWDQLRDVQLACTIRMGRAVGWVIPESGVGVCGGQA